MMKCTTCPHEVGDATERDCAFPDCSGGWEQVYLDSQEHIADLERQLEQERNRADDNAFMTNELARLLAKKDAETERLSSLPRKERFINQKKP